MASLTPIDQLESSINKILTEYGDNLNENLNEAIKKVSKAGVKSLKASSKASFGGSGKYAASWAAASESSRVTNVKAILYSKKPGLPHLLEHGHATRNGGRWTPDGQHIAPVEREIIEAFEREVINEIQ